MEQNTENKQKVNKKASSEITKEITRRFLDIFAELVEMGAIKNKSAFPAMYGINRWNFSEVSRQFPRFRVQLDWLVYLIRDYHVSARWLMTGEGAKFTRRPKIVRKPKKTVTAAQDAAAGSNP